MVGSEVRASTGVELLTKSQPNSNVRVDRFGQKSGLELGYDAVAACLQRPECELVLRRRGGLDQRPALRGQVRHRRVALHDFRRRRQPRGDGLRGRVRRRVRLAGVELRPRTKTGADQIRSRTTQSLCMAYLAGSEQSQCRQIELHPGQRRIMYTHQHFPADSAMSVSKLSVRSAALSIDGTWSPRSQQMSQTFAASCVVAG